MTRKIGMGILMAMMASTAFARSNDNQGNDDRSNRNKHSEKQQVTAPEIDPASAMAGLTLAVSGLAVMRGRRKIK